MENAIDKLDLEADNSISKMQEKNDEVPLVSASCATDTFNGKISFRIPKVVKGPKNKRGPSPNLIHPKKPTQPNKCMGWAQAEISDPKSTKFVHEKYRVLPNPTTSRDGF